ncbi:MAG TPA: hypothetical protein VEC08_04740, partial [Nitrososphaerales archaeon]|nr:hypothetical protein [Nitrososphaerales archaeon]
MTYPLVGVGIAVGTIGLVLIIGSGLQLRRRGHEVQPETSHRRKEDALVGVIGVVLIVLAFALSEIDLTGPGWSIVLYGTQGLYLGTLGLGTLLFGGFAFLTKSRWGALCLATGVVLCGISLLFSYGLSSD